MDTAQLFVTIGGISLSLFIAWFFWFAPKGQTRALVGTSGVQEVAITVKGGYSPDIIMAKAGKPLRLRFTRQEGSACSEEVLFPDFNESAMLPEGEEVSIEINPDKAGEYGFQCKMGMLRGKLIVE